jgi:hypothetical protein
MALVRQRARAARNWLERTGPGRSDALIESAAQAYWRNAAQPGWHSNSDWRKGMETLWDGIGTSTLAPAEQLVGVTGDPSTSANRRVGHAYYRLVRDKS